MLGLVIVFVGGGSTLWKTRIVGLISSCAIRVSTVVVVQLRGGVRLNSISSRLFKRTQMNRPLASF
jgi:alpha-galactosidase/6-phospho-beta-glucosidase family protein